MKNFSKLILASALSVAGAAHAQVYVESFDGANGPSNAGVGIDGSFKSVTFQSGVGNANRGFIGGTADGFAQLGGTSTMTLTFELATAVNSFSLSFYASTLLTNLPSNQLSQPSVRLSNGFASQTITGGGNIPQGIENPGVTGPNTAAGTKYSFFFAAPVALPVATAVVGAPTPNPQAAPWAAGTYSMLFTNIPNAPGIRIDDIELFGNAPAVAPVPEPFTVALALAGLGIVTIGARVSRRA